jgi:hypothetical protein
MAFDIQRLQEFQNALLYHAVLSHYISILSRIVRSIL